MTTTCTMPDVQNSPDHRQIAITKVGVKDLRFPLQIQSREGTQATVANVAMSVSLPEDVKGTHMSRFLKILQENQAAISLNRFPALLQAVAERLESHSAYVEFDFPFFVLKTAPVSGIQSYLDYQVGLLGELKNGHVKIRLQLVVPITSLCPCSKEISAYGAHNQRSHVTVLATLDQNNNAPLEIETLIELIEAQASCELFGLLKRTDEKLVTERAYDNPKFVEDLVRDIAVQLNRQPAILSYRLECENFESIHNHSAYAIIEQGL